MIASLTVLLQQKFIQESVLSFLNENIPWSIPTFTFVKDNVISGSIVGLILYLLFVNIPILPNPPAEAYILFSFLKGTNIFVIILVTVAISLLLATVYYFLGRFFGQRMLEKMLKMPVKYNQFIDRYIGPLIFFVFMLPIPFPIPAGTILVLFAGFYKTDFKKVMAAVGMGNMFRILIVLVLYYLYRPVLQPYLSIFEIG